MGFTLARTFDPRELGLLYYVMASAQTLGDALKRVARYSQITNEALVVRYQEGNRLIINLGYSGVPRHSDRHQIEFCNDAGGFDADHTTNLRPYRTWPARADSADRPESAIAQGAQLVRHPSGLQQQSPRYNCDGKGHTGRQCLCRGVQGTESVSGEAVNGSSDDAAQVMKSDWGHGIRAN